MDTHEHFDEPGAVAFALCEVEWLRTRLLSRLADERLSAFVDDLQEGVGRIDAGVIQEIRRAVDDVSELVDSIKHSFASLPADVDVESDADAIARAAAAALEHGIADCERALHAARWVGPRESLPTLRRMLAATDAYTLWEMPVARFLAAFQGVETETARAIAAEANLADAEFADLTAADVQRLAAVLERRIEGRS